MKADRLALISFALLCLTGCGYFAKRGQIKGAGVSVMGVPDAGKAATLASDTSVGTLPLPAGSKLTVTKWEPVAWRPATDTQPEVKAQPGREVTEVELSRDTQWRKDETKIVADTGTVDTSIAKHRIDAEENRFLLFASLGALAAAGVFLYLKFPTPAMMCAGAAAVLFIAWKVAGLPPWFHVIGFCALAGAVFLHRGYERREKEAKDHAEELAKAKALAVVVPPAVPGVVVPVQPVTPTIL